MPCGRGKKYKQCCGK
ncbi:MAG: SEC-C domain-containing protein [Bacilli bacterium]|nr:SEC-C domain-containing protein [Bacilli bacterium]